MTRTIKEEFGKVNCDRTLTREDLDEHPDYADADVWYQRMKACVKAFDLLEFHPMAGAQTGDQRWHLPPEFPDEEYDYEENDVMERHPLCDRVQLTDRIRAKSPAVFPPLYRRPCAYCTHKFVRWWRICEEADEADDPRPEEAFGFE